jgi:DNA-binding transcriptional MerR regulator
VGFGRVALESPGSTPYLLSNLIGVTHPEIGPGELPSLRRGTEAIVSGDVTQGAGGPVQTAGSPALDADALTASAIDQGLLFGEDLRGLTPHVGYRGPTACRAAGITYRQLDYWARTGLVEPSVRTAHGSGSQRLYSFTDVLVLKVVKRLLDTGVSLQNIRKAVTYLRERGVDDLAQITLMSDGATVYACNSADEVFDLLREGQGVFGIAVGKVWLEVEGDLAHLPSERTDGATDGEVGIDGFAGPIVADSGDELSMRRRRRTAG